MPPHPGLQMPQVHNTPCLSVPGSRSSSSCAPPPRRVPIPLLPFRSRPSSGAAPFPGTKSHTNPPDTAGGLLAARTAPPNRAAKDANRRPQKSAPHAEVLPIGGAGRRRIRRRQEGRPLASFATSRWGCRHVRPPTPCRAVARRLMTAGEFAGGTPCRPIGRYHSRRRIRRRYTAPAIAGTIPGQPAPKAARPPIQVHKRPRTPNAHACTSPRFPGSKLPPFFTCWRKTRRSNGGSRRHRRRIRLNGMTAVSKTAGCEPTGVRIPHPGRTVQPYKHRRPPVRLAARQSGGESAAAQGPPPERGRADRPCRSRPAIAGRLGRAPPGVPASPPQGLMPPHFEPPCRAAK